MRSLRVRLSVTNLGHDFEGEAVSVRVKGQVVFNTYTCHASLHAPLLRGRSRNNFCVGARTVATATAGVHRGSAQLP